jgi:hypothetical protein
MAADRPLKIRSGVVSALPIVKRPESSATTTSVKVPPVSTLRRQPRARIDSAIAKGPRAHRLALDYSQL